MVKAVPLSRTMGVTAILKSTGKHCGHSIQIKIDRLPLESCGVEKQIGSIQGEKVVAQVQFAL